MRVAVAGLVALLSLALASSAVAASIVLRDRVPAGRAASVSVTVRSPAAFRVTLRTTAAGRTKLVLRGASAPKGPALIDTATYACKKSGIALVCRGAYEALPRGTYTFVVVRASGAAAPVTLTVAW